MTRLRKIMVLVVAVLATAPACFAADYVVPDQQIVGATTPVPIGDVVELSISPIKTPPANLTASSYEWTVIDSDGKEASFHRCENLIYFGTGTKPKKVRAFVAATYLYLSKKGDQITDVGVRTMLLTAEVMIGDPQPQPDPNPPPAPLPDGRFGLAKKCRDMAMAKVPAGDSRTKGADALAKSMRGVVSAIDSKAFESQNEVLKQTITANVNAIAVAGVPRDDWIPFFTELKSELVKQSVKNVDGKAQWAWSVEDFKDGLNEIATGLEAVK